MKNQKKNYESEVYNLLTQLGVNHSHKGVPYLIYLIPYLLENDLDYGDMTVTGKDGWYHFVAERFHVENELRIERCLRHVIKGLKNDNETYRTIFPNDTVLTNKQFIMTLCQYIRYGRDDDSESEEE